ncbi:Protein DEL-8, partial [Aphelenchoides avenae]
MDEESIRQMVAYAIAGAGVHDMEKILKKFTVDSRMRLTRLFRKWVGKRSYEVFYKTLFETYGYRCDEAQALIYLTDPGAEAATFPRYYFNPSDWNQIIITKRRIKMLESNPHCEKRCKRCGSECYIKRWLYQRVVDPLNCTLYYQQHHAPGYKVCNPWEIVTRYDDVIDETTNGSTKCLPSCDREDYYFHQVNVQNVMMNGKKAIPNMLFRFDLHYSDLEVETYEEVVTTTVPGF